ncbi:metallophosphoesterase [Arthrobacter sp. efr-133-R2A-120]|uniref:metallophosphoesterase family protein n=1 Tax=Arthrobacter sp. efr-133-R2A-120 TaxID=3040277 RepID=UPI00254C145C|nr:metallophosphoesterase [Arthrobacter sp. efr-133-R2A-120]
MSDPRPIAIFGDWHGNAGWAVTAIRSAAREGAATMLHVGDFGLDWPGRKRGRYEDKLNKHLRGLGATLIVSGGNHDNWETLTKLPVGEAGTAFVRSNIRVLPRGGRMKVEGLVIGALGGAFSVDYEHRTEGKDWWADEEPTPEDAKRLITGGPLDILITHDAPAGIAVKGDVELRPILSSKAERTRTLIGEVVDALAVPYLFCGHWHQRSTHQLPHPDGSITRVDVLDMENSREGNGVLVWPGKAPLRIEPLPIRGN